MRISVAPYTFEWEIHYQCRFPTRLKGAFRPALLAGLNAIPGKHLKKTLGKSRQLHLYLGILSSAQMHKVNKEFRGKDRPTDVLAFSQVENQAPASLVANLGDILICSSIAQKQAPEYGCTPFQELQRLTVHGLLHLFGYDHEKGEKEEKRMFRLQEKILKTLS